MALTYYFILTPDNWHKHGDDLRDAGVEAYSSKRDATNQLIADGYYRNYKSGDDMYINAEGEIRCLDSRLYDTYSDRWES